MSGELVAQPVLEGLYFPEGARWHDDRLWFGEIQAARVSTLDPGGRHEIVAQFESPCSGLGIGPTGSPVASLMRAQQIVRIETHGPVCHADLRSLAFDHINDIVSDARGRVYVDALRYHMRWDNPVVVDGDVTFHGFENQAAQSTEPPDDCVVLVQPDGTARVVADGLSGPNGLGITSDGSALIVAEWRSSRLTRLDILEDGALGERTLFADLTSFPDGICLDEEDAVWYASPESGDCVRVREGGEVVERVVPTAGRRVTACALGGPDMRTLYLTTDRHPEIGGGSIEEVRVGVPGLQPAAH